MMIALRRTQMSMKEMTGFANYWTMTLFCLVSGYTVSLSLSVSH